MKTSNPLLLFPVLAANTDLHAPTEILLQEQKELLKLIDGRTSIAGLALLLGYPLERCQEDIELFVQRKYVTLSQHPTDHNPRYCHPTPKEQQRAIGKKPTAIAAPRKQREGQSGPSPKKSAAENTPPKTEEMPKQKPEDCLFSVPSGLQEKFDASKLEFIAMDPFAPSMKGNIVALQGQKTIDSVFVEDAFKTQSELPAASEQRFTEGFPLIFEDLTKGASPFGMIRDATLQNIPKQEEPEYFTRTKTVPDFEREKTESDLKFAQPPSEDKSTVPLCLLKEVEKYIRRNGFVKDPQKAESFGPQTPPHPIQSAQTEENEALSPEKQLCGLKDTVEEFHFSFSIGSSSDLTELLADLTSSRKSSL